MNHTALNGDEEAKGERGRRRDGVVCGVNEVIGRSISCCRDAGTVNEPGAPIPGRQDD